MKRNILLVNLAVVLSMSMAACGKAESDTTSVLESDTALEIHLEGEIDGIKLSGGSEQEEVEPEETKPESSNDKKFECLPEIEEASIDSGKFQIDDMVFTIGAPVQEIFDALEKSECEYEYEYTPNAIVASNEGVQLTFKKNGNNYIYFYVRNDADETGELRNCRIVNAFAIGNDIRNAYYAGKITAGDSYDNVTEKLADCEIDDEYTDSIDQEYTINYRMCYVSDEEHDACNTHGLELTFDSNTRILKRWSIGASGKLWR